jgi:hypothetical protein
MASLPVLFINYQRPDFTERQFKTCIDLKLDGYFFADYGETKENTIVRKMIEANVPKEDRLIMEHNLGVGYGPKAAITWFFERHKKGIIIEDDIVFTADWIRFVTELLHRYEYDFRIGSIVGLNENPKKQEKQFDVLIPSENGATKKEEEYPHLSMSGKGGLENLIEGNIGGANTNSYLFAERFYSWGWGSWANRWKEHNQVLTLRDIEVTMPQYKEECVGVYIDPNHTWDFQFCQAHRKNRWWCILPDVNLVSNVGKDRSSHQMDQRRMNRPISKLSDNIIHPKVPVYPAVIS